MLGVFQLDSILINFIGAELPHWCRVPELSDLPFEVQVRPGSGV